MTTTKPEVVPIFAGAIAGLEQPSQYVLWVRGRGPLPLVENTLVLPDEA